MSPVYIILIVGGIIFVIALITLLRQRNAIIKRAQKIDPTVKSIAEADYVLKKDIASNVGNNNNNNQ